jgi:two-component system nitrate/nitrite sensor histidine kinase NarX
MRLQTKLLGEILHKKDVRSAQYELRNLKSSIEEAHTSLRELLANYRSRMDERGLIYAVEDLIVRFREESGIKVFFQNEWRKSDISLSPDQEIQVFRIIQEALANIRKHSNSCNVRVLLSEDAGDTYSVLIEDDGLGIENMPVQGNAGEHVGLAIMQERAARLQGDLTIESEPGEGTRVTLTFPQHQHKPSRLEDMNIARSAH